MQKCNICFELFPGIHAKSCATCLHVTCTGCIAQYLEHKVQDLKPLSCYNTECRGPIHPYVIRDLIPLDHYNSYLAARASTSIITCPFIDCNRLQPLSSKSYRQMCSICQRLFCQHCQETEDLATHTCDDKNSQTIRDRPTKTYFHTLQRGPQT